MLIILDYLTKFNSILTAGWNNNHKALLSFLDDSSHSSVTISSARIREGWTFTCYYDDDYDYERRHVNTMIMSVLRCTSCVIISVTATSAVWRERCPLIWWGRIKRGGSRSDGDECTRTPGGTDRASLQMHSFPFVCFLTLCIHAFTEPASHEKTWILLLNV